MKKYITSGLVISAISAVLVGCGGGGSSTPSNTAASPATDNSASGTTARVTGTVPGTFIEAYCDNGAYVSTNSVQNGTSQHPFALDLPVNTPCRLVMTTHENDPAQRVTSQVTINGKKAVTLTGDTDLGYVPLPANYAEASDTNGDHVQDNAIDASPASLNGTPVDDIAQNPYDTNHNGTVDGLEDHNGNGKADEWDKYDAEHGIGGSGDQNHQNGNGTHDTNNNG
jgi:hypothetical protein